MSLLSKFINAPRNYAKARKEHRIALDDNAYAMDCLRAFLNGERSQKDCADSLRKRLQASGGYFDENGNGENK